MQPNVYFFFFLPTQVKFACRHEWARRIEDVLARRLRLLFLNEEAAREAIPIVAGALISYFNNMQVDMKLITTQIF